MGLVDILVLLGLDIRGLDTLVSDTQALDTPIIDILELVSIRNVRPMLNPKPRLSHFTDMDTSALDTLDLDIMDLDILHLDTLDKSKKMNIVNIQDRSQDSQDMYS